MNLKAYSQSDERQMFIEQIPIERFDDIPPINILWPSVRVL